MTKQCNHPTHSDDLLNSATKPQIIDISRQVIEAIKADLSPDFTNARIEFIGSDAIIQKAQWDSFGEIMFTMLKDHMSEPSYFLRMLFIEY